MARRPRNYLPGYTYHIVQRGVNKMATFFEPGDYYYYLKQLQQFAEQYHLSIHAFCLMSNHTHLLVTPTEADSISLTMQVVGSTYAQFINKKYKRTGSLWEGRHKPSLIDTEQYLLACYRYVEMNPVKAGIVQHPGQYQWSSYLNNALGRTGMVKPHQIYTQLGSTDKKRRSSYTAFLNIAVNSDEEDKIEKAISAGTPLAGKRYISMLEERHGIQIALRKRGRAKPSNDRNFTG